MRLVRSPAVDDDTAMKVKQCFRPLGTRLEMSLSAPNRCWRSWRLPLCVSSSGCNTRYRCGGSSCGKDTTVFPLLQVSWRLVVFGAKPPISADFLAAMALNVTEISCPHHHSVPTDAGLCCCRARRGSRTYSSWWSSSPQSEGPVAVVGVPDAVILFGETLENSVLS